MRGERILRFLEGSFLHLDRLIARALPEEMSPLAQSGAIANTTFLVALVSGALLLVWYRVSVWSAWPSLEAMRAAPLTAQLVRSLHRYSSDACMFFVVLHALRLFLARRHTGARWLAWITGLALIALLWLVGWLGYWLVWDERARQVALGSARLVDALPIFTDPLARSLLVDEHVNTLLFFLVFFAHMLVPLAMGVALWLHITRLQRSRFLTGRALTIAVLATLVVMSLLHPALSVGPAHMQRTPGAFTMDALYLLPLWLTDRLGAGALWALLLVPGAILSSLPWTMAKGRPRVATVIDARCNACNQCAIDCPFDAIRMEPRKDGRPHPTVATIDPDKCVGCGICAGSCDSVGVGLFSWLPVPDERHRVDAWIDETVRRGAPAHVAFVCAESAGASLAVDPATGECPELPGYRVRKVPCIGWVHALSVERALRHGARGVLLAGCGEGECRFREGAAFTADRLAGRREPALRADKIDAGRVRLVRHHRIARAALVRDARAFLEEAPPAPTRGRRGVRIAVAAGLLLAVGSGTLALSELPYPGPPARSAALLVTFKHPGRSGENCRTLTPEELAKLPPHMRRPTVCERGRAPVRLRVTVDGAEVLAKSFRGSGLRGDGASVALERVPLSPGAHRVAIEIGDSPDPAAWDHRDERTIAVERDRQAVVEFEKTDGFGWY